MISIEKSEAIMYGRVIKRVLDMFLSLFALILLFPFMLLMLPLVYFGNRGAGLFFLQDRPGKGGKIFKVIKFKTMTDNRDNDGKLLPDSMRLTKVGRFIRSTSLDELPQLINVLKGDMSIVGPRPLLPEYLPLYTVRQAHRHDVLPGITGWAQCNGRNAISWAQKFELDIWYVDNLSFWVDLKIVFATIRKVFLRENINSSESVTAEYFDGTN